MLRLSRRVILGGMAAVPLAMPGIVRAQSTSKPIRIGLLSDMGGPYRDVGGPGDRWAAELAVQDFEGEVLGRKIEVLQTDDRISRTLHRSRPVNGSTLMAWMHWRMARPVPRAWPLARSPRRRRCHTWPPARQPRT